MSQTITPTLQQYLATDYQRNMAVTAGAGTGKTAVLTRRIIKILTDKGYLLDRLLVVTFTDKAAVEMKERIYKAIEEELSSKNTPHLHTLKDTFFNNYISTFHSFCASLLREYPIEAGLDPYFRVLDETDKVFFLRRCIRKTLQELARDKNHRDIHVISGEFSRTALTEAIFTLIQKREDTKDWMQTFPYLQWEEYYERLKKYKECMERELAYKLYRQGTLQACLKELKTIVPELETKESALTRRKADMLRYLPEFLDLLAASQHGPVAIEPLLELKDIIIKTSRLSGSPSKAWAGDAYDRLKGTFITIRYTLDALNLQEFSLGEAHERQGFALLQALCRLTRHCLKTYNQAKAEENYLDFQDLQLKVIDLLEGEKHGHILTELRERFQFLMVDEFQDTNELQWRIIKILSADPQGKTGQPKLFVVGDEKQAIYSFRGGDVSLFSRVRQEVKKVNEACRLHAKPFQLQAMGMKDYTDEYEEQKDGEMSRGEIVFSHNFRSADSPIHFFNLFFHDLFQKEVYEEYEARPQPLLCSGNKEGGSVELMLVDRDEEDEQDLDHHYKEALLIVDKLKEVFYGDDPRYDRVRQKAREGEGAVAILLNRRTKIKTYEEALRNNSIDFSVVRGRGFYQRQEVVDLGNLLQFLISPANTQALIAFLRSPVAHVSDEGIFLLHTKGKGNTLWDKLVYLYDGHTVSGLTEEDRRALHNAGDTLSRWLMLKGRMPLMDFLQLLLNEGGYYASLARGSRGRQAVSNIEKLLDSARDLQLQSQMDLSDFSQWLDNRIDHIEEEGEADIDISLGGAVQIMTVHQAKGLEFPMVFVPDMGAHFNLGEKEALHVNTLPLSMEVTEAGFQREECLELGIQAPDPDNEWEPAPILLKRLIKRRLKDKLIAEKKRLLYVAATRAMDHVIFLGNGRFKSQRTINRALYAPMDQLTSWLEWLNKILGLSYKATSIRGNLTYVNEAEEIMSIPYRNFRMEDTFIGVDREYRTDFPLD